MKYVCLLRQMWRNLSVSGHKIPIRVFDKVSHDQLSDDVTNKVFSIFVGSVVSLLIIEFLCIILKCIKWLFIFYSICSILSKSPEMTSEHISWQSHVKSLTHGLIILNRTPCILFHQSETSSFLLSTFQKIYCLNG